MRTFSKLANLGAPPTRTERHKIFIFATQLGVLVDYQVLARWFCKQGRYCELNFEKHKIHQILGPLTRVRGRNSKKCSEESILNLSLNKMLYSKFLCVQNPRV